MKSLVSILRNTPTTKTIAIISIFTALYAVLRIIPTMPMIGSSGNWFSISDVIAPIYGIILGPLAGGLSTILGTFVAMAMGRPVIFIFLDFLPATVAAVSVGLLIKNKWIYAVGLNVALLAAFLIHPNTSVFVDYSIGGTTVTLPFAWLHIVTLIVLISPLGRKVAQWVKTQDTTKIVMGIAIMFFIGTMMQHLMGNLLFETILAYPIERLVLVVVGTIVGTPLIRVLKKTFLPTEE